jgi:transposase
VDLKRESDIEQLRRIAVAQQTQIEQLLRLLASQAAELGALKGNEAELQQKLALIEELTRQSAELARDTQEAPGAVLPSEPKARKLRTAFGNTAQPSLPVVEQTFQLDAADTTCPSCGGLLAPMQGQFETSEVIDVVEVSYRVIKVQQQKYVCKCGGCVETAPGPERAMPGGRYSLDFAIKVAVDKYLDHIPLARQERILRRHGLVVTTQTLWDQLQALGRRLESASRALLARVLAQPVVGLDQTSWPRLDGKGDKPWQMWCLTAPDAVVHRIRDDKSADTFRDLMGGYAGTVVCDALKTHEAGARGNDAIALAGCWAHYLELSAIWTVPENPREKCGNRAISLRIKRTLGPGPRTETGGRVGPTYAGKHCSACCSGPAASASTPSAASSRGSPLSAANDDHSCQISWVS